MKAAEIDRVFGRGRLKMTTGAQVEVFREAAAPGESRRYTKRFLATPEGDFGEWTEREWRILARLIGHGTRCVPDVVQFDRDAHGPTLVQTYDAGATVDQWATLLPVERNGCVRANVFQDCAHWWALAHHCLAAFAQIHSLGLVHLDVKGDNVCIPVGPPDFDPLVPDARLFPVFDRLALIDFAFSLASGERLATALPIGWQRDYDYQSPRLLDALEAGRLGDLGPTERLDWRCDFYSLATMLKRYLPDEDRIDDAAFATGWTPQRHGAAKALILKLREVHDTALPVQLPHAALVDRTRAFLAEDDLARSLDVGWRLAREMPALEGALPLTPLTRIAPPIRFVVPMRDEARARRDAQARGDDVVVPTIIVPPTPTSRPRPAARRATRGPFALLLAGAALFAFAMTQLLTGSDDGQRFMRRMAAGAATMGGWLRDGGPVTPPPVTAPGATVEEQGGISATAEPDPPNTPAPPEPGPEARERSVKALPPAVPPLSTAPRPSAASVAATTPSRARPESRASAPKAAPPRVPATREPDKGVPRVAGREAPQKRVSVTRGPTPPVIARTQTAAIKERPRMPGTTPTVAAAAVSSAPATVAPTGSVAGMAVTTPPDKAPPVATPAPAMPATLAAATPLRAPAPGSSAPAVGSPGPAVGSPAPAPGSPAPPSVAAAARPGEGVVGHAPIVERSRPQQSASSSREAKPEDRPPTPGPVARAFPAPAQAQRDAGPQDDDDFVDQAHWAMTSLVPRTSAQARIQIAPVLRAAADAHHPAADRLVLAAAMSPGYADRSVIDRETSPRDAQRLHDQARALTRSRRDLREALEVELLAFGADPGNAEIAGHLAYLHLRARPAQPEQARLLALHALGLRSADHPGGRPDDWITFAVASALTGRPLDAMNALYAAVALAGNAERVCQAALGALSVHGEPLREPVESLLGRMQAQGRDAGARACAWPGRRLVELRYR